MLCEKLNIVQSDKDKTNADSVDLELYGYLRGNTLNINNYIHISGFGDYLVTNVEVIK